MKIRNLFSVSAPLASVLPFAAAHEGETHAVQEGSILIPAVGIISVIILIAAVLYLLRKKY